MKAILVALTRCCQLQHNHLKLLFTWVVQQEWKGKGHMDKSVPQQSDHAALQQPPPGSFGDVIERNAKILREMHQSTEARRSTQDRVADTITRFTGSMVFVYLHLAIIGGWVIVNLGWLGIKPFDPYPFGLLTMAGSLEAIFLSTFVLISQNRMTEAASKRAELDLQVNMLTEHELTQLVRLTNALAQHLGLENPSPARLQEAMEDVNPEQVAEMMERGSESAE
ncbi:DUF1003 domain-containing protein [Deinococcus oregonensis]|uniref:DUF1003 domain-containing protein n=1 Tax=Deinococcus oregonensis TaxID=1805970 RepID=A0ABV6ASP3_9DEIO